MCSRREYPLQGRSNRTCSAKTTNFRMFLVGTVDLRAKIQFSESVEDLRSCAQEPGWPRRQLFFLAGHITQGLFCGIEVFGFDADFRLNAPPTGLEVPNSRRLRRTVRITLSSGCSRLRSIYRPGLRPQVVLFVITTQHYMPDRPGSPKCS